ncbi:MAG: hypothetical protein Q9225_007404 [Loekoesia sp. 1 TL-2023]
MKGLGHDELGVFNPFDVLRLDPSTARYDAQVTRLQYLRIAILFNNRLDVVDRDRMPYRPVDLNRAQRNITTMTHDASSTDLQKDITLCTGALT